MMAWKSKEVRYLKLKLMQLCRLELFFTSSDNKHINFVDCPMEVRLHVQLQ